MDEQKVTDSLLLYWAHKTGGSVEIDMAELKAVLEHCENEEAEVTIDYGKELITVGVQPKVP